MRFLVIGVGATGGYFGGRLLEAGRDVTFLVRPPRAERLALTGLTINSPAGNITIRSPATVLAAKLRTPFDVVILSCKAYDLDGAIESFAPAVGPDTTVVPLLNGMRHLDALDARFGANRYWAGHASSQRNSEITGRSLTSATSTGWLSASEPVVHLGGSQQSPRPWRARNSRPSQATTLSWRCGRSGCSWRRWPQSPA
jgi:2-dehydropantoate 2-reductase